MQRRDVLASPTFQIEGVTMYPHLIGDSAYPISHSLLNPYKNNNSQLQTIFDRFLSRGRVKIENAFGLLKGRWRILRDIGVELDKVPRFVVACRVLHNFLQMNGEVEPDIQIDPHPNSIAQLHSEAMERDQGQAQRDRLFCEWERHYNFSNMQ
eukprot:Gb_14975 [translate_table: standard]